MTAQMVIIKQARSIIFQKEEDRPFFLLEKRLNLEGGLFFFLGGLIES
jgi:hypothetical protein